MKTAQEQYELIADTFPKPRGSIKISNRRALNGILYILEHDCKRWALPERFGNWHTVYMRFSRWAKSGVLKEVFSRPATGTGHRPPSAGVGQHFGQGPSRRCRRSPKAGTSGYRTLPGRVDHQGPMVSADARTAIVYALSPGQDHDGPHGRRLLRKLGPAKKKGKEGEQLQLFLVADRAYDGNETRRLAVELSYTPVIPPRSNHRDPWHFDQQIYKRRNEVERLFRRLKGYRRVFVH